MSHAENTDAATSESGCRRPGHIGIVACSAEGAALCYGTICTEGPRLFGPYAHPEVSMHTPSFAEYTELGYREDWQGVGELMLASADKLARIGAEFLICPDNSVHRAFDYVAAGSPLPWLHIAEVVAEEAAARGFRRIGLLGTRWLVDSEVYPEKLAARGLAYVRPTSAEREEVNRIIMEELVFGVFKPAAVAYHERSELAPAAARFYAAAGAGGAAPGSRRSASLSRIFRRATYGTVRRDYPWPEHGAKSRSLRESCRLRILGH